MAQNSQNLFACRPSWLRGLEILLDHWLHECSGLPNSHPARGVFFQKMSTYTPTRGRWIMMDHGYSWMIRWCLCDVMWWLPCAGDATTQQERPVGLGWHGDPYWGQTNRRWWNCRHSSRWQVLTVESADRAHVPEEGQKYKTPEGETRQDDRWCAKISWCFFPFCNQLCWSCWKVKTFTVCSLKVPGGNLSSAFRLDANDVSFMETWKPWKRWKLSHLKRLINWHHLERRKWKNPQYNDT